MALTKREAVMAAQRLLRVAADGKWGPITDTTYLAADAATQRTIDQVLIDAGLTVASIRSFQVSGGDARKTEQRKHSWIPAQQIGQWVRKAASAVGMDQYADALIGFLHKEARSRVIDGTVYYDPQSQNGSSRGLMQMQSAAWTDARKVDPTLPTYDYVFDPAVNIRAGVAYAKWNLPGLLKRKVSISADTLYLAHNQGLGFFDTPSRVTNYAGQSAEVQALIDRFRRS